MLQMKLSTIAGALLVAIVAADGHVEFSSITATVSVQVIDSRSMPIMTLAEIQFEPSGLNSEISSFNAPALPSEARLLRIGIYDPVRRAWKSSTSVTSAYTFRKEYAPIFALSLDILGEVVGVSIKGGKIDAGQTRDFGPKLIVGRIIPGKSPELNRPLVVSNESIAEGELEEKSLFQKYWWVAAGAMVLLLATGGGEK